MLALEKPVKADVSTIYGIIPRPGDGLQEIQELWTQRTSRSYHPLAISKPIEQTLWRNARTGKISQWHPGMIGETTKERTSVVEDWINLDILPLMSQVSLALGQITNYKQSIISIYRTMMRGQSTGDKIPQIFAEILTEIDLYPTRFEIEQNLSDLIDLLPDLQNKLGSQQMLAQFSELIERSRFEHLDALIQASDWIENCQQLQEIHERQLYRFKASSFEQYCKDSRISGGMRRVKIGHVIRQVKSSNLNLPKNKGQAFALAEIPTESRLRVWQCVLESNQKITAKFIEQTHQQILNLPQKPKSIIEVGEILAKITKLSPNHQDELGVAVMGFIEKMKTKNQGSELEIKMLRLILNRLQELAKSDSPQTPFADE